VEAVGVQLAPNEALTFEPNMDISRLGAFALHLGQATDSLPSFMP
jgi:hypothetical protein